jgi:uncharacterized damage-inducible protein DinB
MTAKNAEVRTEPMPHSNQPEPWLRGTLADVPAVQRGILHALELAQEDIKRWCADMSEEEMNHRPGGLPSVAFQLRHIVGSIDRLLTYAERRELSPEQLKALKSETEPANSKEELLRHVSDAIRSGTYRVQKFNPADFEQTRTVGRSKLPATLGGLLVHIADHTQRHVGQLVTTAKVVIHERGSISPQGG